MGRKITIHTPEQIDFVRRHKDEMTTRQICDLLEKEPWEILKIKEGLRDGLYQTADDVNTARVASRYSINQPKKRERPPAVYLNRSHEQTIEYWMNYQI